MRLAFVPLFATAFTVVLMVTWVSCTSPAFATTPSTGTMWVEDVPQIKLPPVARRKMEQAERRAVYNKDKKDTRRRTNFA